MITNKTELNKLSYSDICHMIDYIISYRENLEKKYSNGDVIEMMDKLFERKNYIFESIFK